VVLFVLRRSLYRRQAISGIPLTHILQVYMTSGQRNLRGWGNTILDWAAEIWKRTTRTATCRLAGVGIDHGARQVI
jgi:hypothetical protein